LPLSAMISQNFTQEMLGFDLLPFAIPCYGVPHPPNGLRHTLRHTLALSEN
jgi:hypothetical protein